jgi:hypothetical protein
VTTMPAAPEPAPFRGPLAAAWGGRAAADALLRTLRPAAAALPVPPATDRTTWDAVDPATVAALTATGDPERGIPWPVTTASTAARLYRDGDRDQHEQRVFARQHRLTRAAVLAAVTPDDAHLDEVADGVLTLCEQTSWCWPAHDRTTAARGDVLPDVTEPFLDLGAGEVAGRLAWVDHLLGAALDARWPGLRRRIRHEVDLRVLRPFETRHDWHWIGLDGDVHNWNPWIHGNVLLAALALLDDPDDAERRARLVARAVTGLDRYVAVLPADGAIDEGYSYWWNGACRALEALDLLRHATDGDLDATSIAALAATVAFPHRMHLGGDWYVNVADGQARPGVDQPWAALHRAARAYGDPQAAAHAAARHRPGAPLAAEDHGLGRLLLALTDPAWAAAAGADPRPADPLPREVWLPSVQVAVARTEDGSSRGLTLAAKGGHDDEHHNHCDVGSFVVAVHGVPVLVDAGRPTYTRQTFSDDRYAIWTMRSDWHNVPQVRGTDQPPSREAAARGVHHRAGAGSSALDLDLTAAYPRDDLRSWRRTAALDRSTGRVTVRDAWSFTGPAPDDAPPSVLHLLLAGEVGEVGGVGGADGDDVLVRAVAGGGRVRVRWQGPVTAVRAEVRPLDDPMLTEVWGDRLTRLTLVLADDLDGAVTVTVEEVP